VKKRNNYKVTRIVLSTPFGQHQVGLCELTAPTGMVTRSGDPVPRFGVAVLTIGGEQLLSTGQTEGDAIKKIFNVKLVQQRARLAPEALALVEALEALNKQYDELEEVHNIQEGDAL
jgi:hypothetical protein